MHVARQAASASLSNCDVAGRTGTIKNMKRAARYRFSRAMRLLKADDFSSVFSLRRSRGDAWFQVLTAPNGLSHARLGLVVGKKVDRRAVGRNAIKRLVRELFRASSDGLAGLDIVVRARRPVSRSERQEARAALQALLLRSGKCRA